VEAVALATTEIKRMRSRLRKDVRVVGVGVALPGLVRREDGVVRLAPHLGWIDEPFSGRLSDAVGLPVSTANDASVGATAESRFGAGRGVRDLVYLNGGASGIGGGVIVEGRPLTGVTGYAGELGHTLVNSAGILCHCGATGCLETEVTQSRLLDVLGLDDPEMDELDHAIAVSESPEVRDEIDRQLTFLAVTLRNAVNIFNPRLIVLGGFLGALFEASPGTIERAIAEQTLAGPGDCVEVVRAQLRSRLLMIGAAELAFAALLADPASSAT
jgi:predicted NBD/HSP70 family sugar kinase